MDLHVASRLINPCGVPGWTGTTEGYPMNVHAIDTGNHTALHAIRIRHIYPYVLFNKSPLELRRIGALGGKAHGRNQRARRALMPAPPAATPLRSAPQQSTADDVAALDFRFPWLRGAEKRRSGNQHSAQSRQMN
jgi:hypothetical protein